MKIIGLNFLSRNDIDLKAEGVLEYYDDKLLERIQPIPLISFTEHLRNKYQIAFNFIDDLGSFPNGSKILGYYNFKPRAIFIDSSLQNDEHKFNFTLAHELGHLVLHRNIKFEGLDYTKIEDAEYDIATGKKILQTDKDWIEWQANSFASSFLMPRTTFRMALAKVQQSMGISRNLGMVFLDNQGVNLKDFYTLKEQLGNIFKVSKSVVEYRLESLGLLNDQRLKDVQHISKLFREEYFF
jgi:Zn-dependent peptidase ImmA (M78 family)